MSLTEKINNDIKSAMLAKEAAKLIALRAIKAEILLANTAEGASGSLTPEAEIKILQKLVKQRRESAEIYKTQNRQDLYDQESFEANVIEAYLPQKMSEAEIIEAIKKVIAETGASSQKDMGKVMGIVSKQLAGKADNKVVAEKVKELLGA